jgi:hypothetical protein
MEAHKAKLDAEISDAELESVVAALEPDQLTAAKEKYHCPRRKLSTSEIAVFWALRVYLLFMFGVVLYQVLTGTK